MVSDGSQPQREVTDNHNGEHGCDMDLLSQQVMAAQRHSTVGVCVKTIEDEAVPAAGHRPGGFQSTAQRER